MPAAGSQRQHAHAHSFASALVGVGDNFGGIAACCRRRLRRHAQHKFVAGEGQGSALMATPSHMAAAVQTLYMQRCGMRHQSELLLAEGVTAA
jgi:hypothetical protein